MAFHLGFLVYLWAFSAPVTAELLGRISDDTAPAAAAAPPAAKQSDRKIIYRVICSPEDQDLPDCDKSAVDDGNEAGQGANLPMPDLPPDSQDVQDKPAPAAVPAKAVEKQKPQKSSRHKAAAEKKSVQKTAAKKSSAVNKPAAKKPAGKKRTRK